MSQKSSFEVFRNWMVAVPELNQQPLNVSRSDLETIAVCLSDIHDHCSNAQSELEALVSGVENENRFESAVVEVEVQLALAVRNWHELEGILTRNNLWPEGTEVFDQLSVFENE
jgi:hypothetical protein